MEAKRLSMIYGQRSLYKISGASFFGFWVVTRFELHLLERAFLAVLFKYLFWESYLIY